MGSGPVKLIAKAGNKVKCIIATGSVKLQVGLIYTVRGVMDNTGETVNDTNPSYRLEELLGYGPYGNNRFIVVEEPATTKRSAQVTLIPSGDQEEERLRDILTRPSPGNCKCGCLRQSCPYHKDS